MDQPSLDPPVILVVEDEPLIRALAVDILEEAGFEVVEAPTADYAITVLDKRSDVRVVFTDVDMPGKVNGFELARFVQDHHQHIGVIVGSGKCYPAPGEVPPATVF